MIATRRAHVARHFLAYPAHYSETELNAPVDIPLEMRRAILHAHEARVHMNHYELLNVSQEADRNTIRHAYFELAKVYHPDAMFGRELGLFRARMEAVFTQLTRAYEVLSNRHRRRIYDSCIAYVRGD